jgi:hypothetical protein
MENRIVPIASDEGEEEIYKESVVLTATLRVAIIAWWMELSVRSGSVPLHRMWKVQTQCDCEFCCLQLKWKRNCGMFFYHIFVHDNDMNTIVITCMGEQHQVSFPIHNHLPNRNRHHWNVPFSHPEPCTLNMPVARAQIEPLSCLHNLLAVET